jgi:hypothetical protein
MRILRSEPALQSASILNSISSTPNRRGEGSRRSTSSYSTVRATGAGNDALLETLVEQTENISRHMLQLERSMVQSGLEKGKSKVKSKKKKTKKILNGVDKSGGVSVGDSTSRWQRQREWRDSIPIVISHPLTKRLQAGGADSLRVNDVGTKTPNNINSGKSNTNSSLVMNKKHGQNGVDSYFQSIDYKYDPSLAQLVQEIEEDLW